MELLARELLKLELQRLEVGSCRRVALQRRIVVPDVVGSLVGVAGQQRLMSQQCRSMRHDFQTEG